MLRRWFVVLCVVSTFVCLTAQSRSYAWEKCRVFGARQGIGRVLAAHPAPASEPVIREADKAQTPMPKTKVIIFEGDPVVVFWSRFYDSQTEEEWYQYSSRDPNYEPIDDYS